jgi:transposase
VGFIGGVTQREAAARIRDAERDRLLAVPIDIGKRAAKAFVCDFWGEIVAAPFEFRLDASGLEEFKVAVARASAARDAVWTRVGLEQAGHYHVPLLARLQQEAFDVVVFNPAQVSANRAQDLLRSLKSDNRDLGALAELLIRAKGHHAIPLSPLLAEQAILAAQRGRKIDARRTLKNQILATLDLVFPGLDGCFKDIFDSPFGRLLLGEGFDPGRVRRLGPQRMRAFLRHRGMRTRTTTIERVVETARNALVLPEPRALLYGRVLGDDVDLLEQLDRQIARCESQLATLLPDTPAGILTTIPYVSVVRASNYGAALGDPGRFRTAAQVYRSSGLVPKLYESAGRRRASTHISREGSVDLRQAILELGIALRNGHQPTARYARELEARGKPGGVVNCALGRRANRIAFAMVRDQAPFDPSRW